MRATTGKRGPAAVLAIGVRQQSAYQRNTLLERRGSWRRRGDLHAAQASERSVPPGVEHVPLLEQARECLAVLTVADEAEPLTAQSRGRRRVRDRSDTEAGGEAALCAYRSLG